MKLKRSCSYFVFTLLLAPVFPAEADVTMFSDRATWKTASSSLESIHFSGLGNILGKADPDAATVKGAVLVDDDPFGGSLGCLFEIGNNPNCPANTEIQITLPSDVTSLGWDSDNLYRSGIVIEFLSGAIFTGKDLSGFIGFTSSDPVRSLNIPLADLSLVTDFVFGSAVPESSSAMSAMSAMSEVPEPASVLLLVTLIVWVSMSRISDRPLRRPRSRS